LYQLLSEATVTSHSFLIKCSMCPPCCWTTHSNRRRHWSTKRCDSLPHLVTITCFSRLIVGNCQCWYTIWWRAPQTAYSTGFKYGLFGATCQARSTLITQSVSSPAAARCLTFHKVV